MTNLIQHCEDDWHEMLRITVFVSAHIKSDATG